MQRSAASSALSRLRVALTVAVCTTSLQQHVAARPEYVEMIPNGANVPGVAALGHTNNIGAGGHNAFGEDFADAGHKWTKEFCEMDSDGDGQHNGAELGDPCCEWALKTNQKVEWIEGVSSPADATKISDPALWAKINCTTTTDYSATTPTATSKVPAPASNSAVSVSGVAVALTTAVFATATSLVFV